MRTDLALEQHENLVGEIKGVSKEELTLGKAKITKIGVLDEEGEKAIGKPKGNYITIEVEPFSQSQDYGDGRQEAISQEIANMLPKEGTILIAGIGNSDITPDALGPKTARGILATRHISKEFAQSLGLGELRSVATISTGVLGKTGMETAEILKGIVENIKPSAVIVIDALASRSLSRLGCTVQISDTGISPGSGVGNSRSEISEKTLGVPVIAIGVPTVVDAVTLASDIMNSEGNNEVNEKISPRGEQMMVTPRDVDLMINNASSLVSLSINRALHPHISNEDMLTLVS